MALPEPGPSVPTASADAPADAATTSAALSAIVEEEFDDPRRLDLLHRLVQLIGLTSFPPAWACLWLADLEQLESLIRTATANPSSGHTIVRGFLQETITPMLPMWLSKTRNPPQSTGTSIASASGSRTATPSRLKRKLEDLDDSDSAQKRSALAVTACNERDGNACVLTKDGAHDVAHLYPFSLHNPRPGDVVRTSFWSLLGTFWSQHRLESWKKALFPNGRYDDVCYNLMGLSPSAHRYYGKAYFALKPISVSEDQTRFTVQFFWLSRGEFEGDSRFLLNIESRPSLSLAGLVGPDRSRLWNHVTGKPIHSGDMVTMETHNPISHPLPKWEIMEMQWFLQRAAAISGAAEVYDDDDNGDDDDIGVLASDDGEMEYENDYATEFESTGSEPESQSSGPSSISTSLNKATASARTSLDTVVESSADVEGQ